MAQRVDLNKKLDGNQNTQTTKTHKSKRKKLVLPLHRRSNPLEKITQKSKAKKEPEKIDYQEIDNEVLQAELTRQNNEVISAKKREIRNKIVAALLIIGCVYLVFLIFGVINTQYVYDDSGNVVPQRMSVEQIEEMEYFNEYALQYRQARSLYEQVLVLDYRIGAGEEEPTTIAPEYETLLESINDLAIQINALELPAEYTQTLSMLSAWVETDIAVYCQSMSKAISQNDAESAELALQFKATAYNDFSAITQNTIAIGQQVKGADFSDIVEWSPETYIQEAIGGIVDYGE